MKLIILLVVPYFLFGIAYYLNSKNKPKWVIRKLIHLTRMPGDVEIVILTGTFKEVLQTAPSADINIFGMQENPDISMVREITESIQTSVLFLKDSKHESALA